MKHAKKKIKLTPKSEILANMLFYLCIIVGLHVLPVLIMFNGHFFAAIALLVISSIACVPINLYLSKYLRGHVSAYRKAREQNGEDGTPTSEKVSWGVTLALAFVCVTVLAFYLLLNGNFVPFFVIATTVGCFYNIVKIFMFAGLFEQKIEFEESDDDDDGTDTDEEK